MHQDKPRVPIRIGRINFTNVWPIFYYFPLSDLGDQVEVISQLPTQLNEAMSAGLLDLGPISSFAYGEEPDKYVLYPDLSVSAHGSVNSILLFHRKPLDEILSGTFVLPTTSATSVNLLKIILNKFYNAAPAYRYASPSLEDMMLGADAALLIGDHAIQASLSSHSYHVTDLGKLWTSLTGEWMTFAVWAVRRETANAFPELVSTIFSCFQKSKQQGHRDKADMITAAQLKVGGTKEYWQQYFGRINYDFGPEQQKGLKLYYQYAAELGLLKRTVPLLLWADKMTKQVNE